MSILDPRNSKVEKARALIAVSVKGNAIVMSTNSEWVKCEIDEVNDNPEDLGMCGVDAPDHGLWLWEGTLQVVMSGSYDCQEPETQYNGTMRRVQPEELETLLAMEPPPHDPVHQYAGQWFFWDETWADRVGPFANEDACRRALYEYALSLGGE